MPFGLNQFTFINRATPGGQLVGEHPSVYLRRTRPQPLGGLPSLVGMIVRYIGLMLIPCISSRRQRSVSAVIFHDHIRARTACLKPLLNTLY